MDKILKAIKCSECNKILETPVLLPCHHSICQKHVIETKKIESDLLCSKCDVDHEIPSNGFPLNEALCDIIEAQISSIDFGSVHKEATESCAKLSRFIKDMTNLLNNPGAYSYEEICQLKNLVNLKSEQLKLKIDEETEKMINNLNEYQNLCNILLTNDLNLMLKRKYLFTKELCSSNLTAWNNELNSLKFDESKWKKITFECNKSIEVLDETLKKFKDELLLGEFKKYSNQVVFFQQISIDGLFEGLFESRVFNCTKHISSNSKIGFNSFGESSSQLASKRFNSEAFDYFVYSSTPKKPRNAF